MIKVTKSSLQEVTTDQLVIEHIRAPRKGGGYVMFKLTQPLVLKRGDSYCLDKFQVTKSSVVPVLDKSGQQAVWPDETPVTRTQINAAELRFLVQRAGHKKIKAQWRYGNIQEATK